MADSALLYSQVVPAVHDILQETPNQPRPFGGASGAAVASLLLAFKVFIEDQTQCLFVLLGRLGDSVDFLQSR